MLEVKQVPMEEDAERRVVVQLKNEDGSNLGNPFDLPISISIEQLQQLANQLLNLEDIVPCAFYIDDEEIRINLQQTIEAKKYAFESVLEIICTPQAIFRVRPVTRCTASIPGHGEAITCAQFSPDGRYLASGSGDTTVRFWDVSTETPQYTCKAHKHWILCVAWAPNGKKLASGCKNGQIYLWDPVTGEQIGSSLSGHKKWITWLNWEPLHMNGECRMLASSSKDNDIRIWDTVLGQCVRVLAGHTAGVTCIRWGGEGLLFSASQDRTVKVWRTSDGVLCRTLEGHGHWVNTMALNTDYAMRTGAFDPKEADVFYKNVVDSAEVLKTNAKQRYDELKGPDPERMATGSDDFTLFLWRPSEDKKPLARMTGHQQLINQVAFSPDGRIIASASFDKSVKLWDGKTGKYLTSLRGHVQAVYVLAWSADSRMLVSGSADSTIKLWSLKDRKLSVDLPGHADEVYAVDWSPDGQRVVSGGKDKVLKLWRK